MADDKTESITVNVKKAIKSDKEPTKAEKKGGGYLSNAVEADTDDDVQMKQDQANRQGKVIQPTKAAKNAAAERTEDEDAESTTADEPDLTDKPKSVADSSQLNTPVETDPLPGDKDDVESAPLPTSDNEEPVDPDQMTVAAHATQQREALVDNRDYKISKKELKKAPQRSGSHLHKTWVFIALVTIASVGLAYGYLTVVEGLDFEEITSRLGL